MIQVIISSPRFYRVLYSHHDPSAMAELVSTEDLVSTIITYSLTTVLFLLNCFSPSTHVSRNNYNPSPYLSAAPLSSLILGWMTPFIMKGYRKYTTEEDLFDPLPELESERSYQRWKKLWDRELQRAKYNPEDGSFDVNHTPSLLRTLLVIYWARLPLIFTVTIFRPVVKTAAIFVLYELTTYMGDESQLPWKGYLYAVLLLILDTSHLLFQRHSDVLSVEIGIKIKGILSAAIYHKALRISSKSQRHYSTGKVVSLVSIDTERVLQLCIRISRTSNALFQLTISMILLWLYLGPACLAAIAVMLLMVYLAKCIIGKCRQLQGEQMKLKDARLKSMNEIIGSIKILKLFAWESLFTARVGEVRDEEVSVLKKFVYRVVPKSVFGLYLEN